MCNHELIHYGTKQVVPNQHAHPCVVQNWTCTECGEKGYDIYVYRMEVVGEHFDFARQDEVRTSTGDE